MEFLHASIALLASMVLVLAGMVGWLYWQQTRLFQNMNSIVMVIGELARPTYAPVMEAEPEEQEETAAPPSSPVLEAKDDDDEDDRVSVKEESGIETVEGPAADDNDDLEGKTTKELRDLLTKRGIPFGKRDNKGALISLLKATSS